MTMQATVFFNSVRYFTRRLTYSEHFYMTTSNFTIRDVKRLFFGLIIFECCLVFAYIADHLLDHPSATLHRLFDLDGERTIPALFSSAQLFLVGLVFLLIGRETNPTRLPSPLFFFIVGAGFIFLALDEAISIHEKITHAFKNVAWMPRFKGNHGIWILLYPLIGSIIFLIVYQDLKAMWNRYRSTSMIIVLGAGIFVFGGIVLEILSYQFLRTGTTPILYKGEVALEEFLEMVGISVIFYGALVFAIRGK
jgi:hypothetical protein